MATGELIDILGIALGSLAFLIGMASLLSSYGARIGMRGLLWGFVYPAIIPAVLFLWTAAAIRNRPTEAPLPDWPMPWLLMADLLSLVPSAVVIVWLAFGEARRYDILRDVQRHYGAANPEFTKELERIIEKQKQRS